MMFKKFGNKENDKAPSTSTDKDGDGDHRGGYRTHLIFAGKRDPEGGGGHSSVSQSGSHYYLGGQSTTSFSSHSSHPFGQAQQPPTRPTSQDRRKGSARPPGLPPDEDFYRQSNKQVSHTLFHLILLKSIFS